MTDTAFIIGNGVSRQNFDLSILKGHGTTYGCNLLYTESHDYSFPDYIVSIEEYRKEQIEIDGFPKERCIFPPEEEQYQSLEFYQDTGYRNVKRGSRSNAGMLAIDAAIKSGHRYLYMFGFDFLINGEQAISNMFSGRASTRCSFADSLKRVKYFEWYCRKHSNIMFYVMIPSFTDVRYHPIELPNVKGYRFNLLEAAIFSSNS